MELWISLALLPGLIVGLTVHEASHALAARWLGDDLAWKQGRVSLNPFRHLSLIGTLALFLLGFGWARPVPVNLYHFRHPKFYFFLTAMAGPASNVVLCGLFYLVLRFIPMPPVLAGLVTAALLINGILAVVNLVPIPPLDGSRIWPCVIPGMRPTISGRWSTIWLVVLIVAMYTGLLGRVLEPVIGVMAEEIMPLMVNQYIPSGRPDHLPAVLQVPEGASETEYYCSLSDDGEEHYDCAAYAIPAEYPSLDALAPLYARLWDEGFTVQCGEAEVACGMDGEWRPAMEDDALCGYHRTELWTNEAQDEVVIDCLVQLEEEGQDPLPEYGVCAWYYYGGLADPQSQPADPNGLLTDPSEPAADPNDSAGANAGGVSW